MSQSQLWFEPFMVAEHQRSVIGLETRDSPPLILKKGNFVERWCRQPQILKKTAKNEDDAGGTTETSRRRMGEGRKCDKRSRILQGNTKGRLVSVTNISPLEQLGQVLHQQVFLKFRPHLCISAISNSQIVDVILEQKYHHSHALYANFWRRSIERKLFLSTSFSYIQSFCVRIP